LRHAEIYTNYKEVQILYTKNLKQKLKKQSDPNYREAAGRRPDSCEAVGPGRPGGARRSVLAAALARRPWRRLLVDPGGVPRVDFGPGDGARRSWQWRSFVLGRVDRGPRGSAVAGWRVPTGREEVGRGGGPEGADGKGGGWAQEERRGGDGEK
jgi:hypothetical protein